jgi:hypothetical protein
LQAGAARIIWWLGEHEPKEVFIELRLGWKRYLKEDLFAGFGLACRMLSGERRLVSQEEKIQNALNVLAHEHGYESFWRAPERAQEQLRQIARNQLAGMLPGFDSIVASLEPPKAVRRLAWAAAIWAVMSTQCKLFVSVVSAQVGCLTSTVTLSGRLDDDDEDVLGLTYWRNRQLGLERLDIRWCPDPSNNPSWFAQIRMDQVGERVGAGFNWREDLGHNVSFGFQGRVLSQGIRGTPEKPELSLWPSLRWQVNDEVALGGFAFHCQPIGDRGSTSFGPEVGIKLSDRDSVTLAWWLPGTNPEVDFCHTVNW